MSTQSPNFNLTIATTADTVNVVTQIASNFSTLDTALSYVITSTGAMKPSLFLPVPQLSSPTITGSMTGVFSVTASTGLFNTVTATSGSVTVGYLGIGTYSLPTTLGATGALLTVQTGNAQWVAPSGGTGANTGLSNLASVAINTNMNSFTASAVTMSAVIATSGSLTGLTVFQATTGTFAGNLTVTGTLTANAVVCTGGIATFAGVAIGTYSLPSTLGASGQFLKVASATAGWADATSNAIFTLISGSCSSVGFGAIAVSAFTTVYDPASSASSTGYTTPSSGVYNLVLGGALASGTNNGILLTLSIGATSFTQASLVIPIHIIQTVGNGIVISATAAGGGGGAWSVKGIGLSGFKIPNM